VCKFPRNLLWHIVFGRVIILSLAVFYFSENTSLMVMVLQDCSTPSVINLNTKYFFGYKVLCVVVNR
jgi:hypothetical protein